MIPKESTKSIGTTASSFKSSVRTTSEEYIHTYLTIPPDGGWGWVIVFTAFFYNFVSDGAMYTFGIFLHDIGDTFQVSTTDVGTVSSLMTGCFYFSGPITCGLVNQLGFQVTAVLGGVISAVAFAVSPYLGSFLPFLIVMGILGGLGFGMLYVPSIIATGFYFERWRALASSLGLTGSSAGMILFPILIHSLSDYTWQIRFMIISGFCLLCGLLGFLYRPVKPTRVITNKDHVVVQVLASMDEITSLRSTDSKKMTGFFRKIYNRFHNVKYPTHAKLYKDSTMLMFFPSGPSTSSVLLNTVAEDSSSNFMDGAVSKLFDNRSERFDKLSVVYENDNIKTKKCRCSCKCWKWCCGRTHINRPMYRDDIFYGGSLFTLSEYTQTKASQMSRGKSIDYTLSVTRVDLKEKDKCCPESVLRTLVTMLHFQLLKSIPFTLFALSGFFTVLGMYAPFVYLIERSTEFNIDYEVSHYFYTAVGISNFIGRVFHGAVSSIPSVNSLTVTGVSLTVCGVTTIVSCFFKDIYVQFVFCAVFGFTLASWATLRTPVVVDLLGLENLTNAFGLMLLFNGVAAYLGVPIAGKIISLTNSFNNGFLFSGGVILLSGVLVIPIKVIINKK